VALSVHQLAVPDQGCPLPLPCRLQRSRSSSLRCFTAVVRGQALQQQQAAPRAARAAVVARAAYQQKAAEPEEEQQYEQDDTFQERVVQVRRDGPGTLHPCRRGAAAAAPCFLAAGAVWASPLQAA
jgi:hypothetical protein